MNPPQMSLNIPIMGFVGSSASRASHSGWARASSEEGAAMNGAIQRPGTNPAAAMAAATPSTPEGNFSLVAQPVPDRGLVSVVELEDVEGPLAGAGQVGRDVGLGDAVEVVVPRAPAHLVRGRDPSVLGLADVRRPLGEQLRRIVA